VDDWQTQLKKSSIAFDTHFKEAVKKVFKGDFEIVEGVTKYEMAKTLDQLAGIDLWYFNTNLGVRGVSNRIQFGEYSYKTFTIRKSRESGIRTEYDKRKFAIENDYLYPVLTLQGYINSKNEVLGFAVAKTTDIIWMIDNGYFFERKTGINQIGQALFYCVNWDDMKNKNLNIYIH